ncbi:MAG TPA: hypothetical protein VFK05_21705 [Polyangiaceae bacterium]|nr:hypothetical protein [Polyangiaceae bacterium]
MARRWRLLACLALNLGYLGACTKSDPAGQSSVSQASTSASASASAAKVSEPSPANASEPSPAIEEAKTKPACRALSVTGLARVDGVPITTAALLDGAHWLELEAGASVALRHSQTSREFRLIGPGHALPCRDGSEQILLADGQISTSALLGVRPGAEVLIATPAGVAHYGDAALDLEVGSKGLRVRVKQGEAWLEPEAGAKPRFSNPLPSGAEARLPKGSATAESLAAACQSAAQTAESSARRVLGGDGTAGGDSLGARAAAHMRQRSKARFACAIAAAAAFTESDPATRQRLSAAVAHADALWQSVPRVGPERAGKN